MSVDGCVIHILGMQWWNTHWGQGLGSGFGVRLGLGQSAGAVPRCALRLLDCVVHIMTLCERSLWELSVLTVNVMNVMMWML